MTTAQEYADQIIKARSPEHPFYLLVNPLKSVWDHYLISIPTLKEKLGEENLAVVPRPDLIHEPENSPHLVLLAKAGEDFTEERTHILRYSINYAFNEHPGSRRYVCAWLQSPLSLQDQAQNIAQRMYFPKEGIPINEQQSQGQPKTPANTNLYPIYEPLRQELLGAASYHEATNTHSAWLHPISLWILPTPDKNLLQYKGKAPENTHAQLAQLSQANQLSRNSIQTQAEEPIVSDIISVWHSYLQTELTPQQKQQLPLLQYWGTTIAPGAAYQSVLYVREARRKGLTNRHDQITYAIMRFLVHPQFDDHPIIQTIVAQASKKQGTYSDLLGQINHLQWMQIITQLNNGTYLNLAASPYRGSL